MGSEQSSQQQNVQKWDNQKQIRRQHTIANPGSVTSPECTSELNDGSISPGPSVCSDTDLPYISYTVNRPIGDSPKLTNKQIVKKPQRKLPKTLLKQKSTNSIVIVNKSQSNQLTSNSDSDIVRLQSIPMFLPIMRATLNLPAARDPEVLERLDPTPLQRFCVKYQTHLTYCANSIATEQNLLVQKMREIDADITKIMATFMDKQKRFAKYAEKLGRVQDLSHQLNRCHMVLNHILESMETLNGVLNIEDRLEPFVWTTG